MKVIYSLFLFLLISFKLLAGGCTPPTVVSQPSNTVVCENGNAFFQIIATGPSLNYQWQIDQGAGFINLSNIAPFSGVTTDLLTITGATLSLDNSAYRCIVTNGCVPDDTSAAALLKINVSPSIATQPNNTIVCEGSIASFSLISSGSGLAYQWQVNDGSGFVNVPSSFPYSGDTTGALFITGTPLSFNGYTFQCIVSGACAPSVTSSIVTLTVNELPSIDTQPSFSAVCENDTVTIGITASGTGLNYQWQVNQGSGYSNLINSSLYAGVNTNTLSISGATATMNGYLYQCIVSGACMPSDTSYEIPLIVYPTYSLFTSATICQGDTLAFGASNLTAPGFYSNTFSTFNGCDSLVFLSLSVNSAYFTTTTSTICDGDSVSLGGIYQSTAGVYTFVLPAVTGCDSTIEHTLVINPSYSFSQTTTICEGDSTLIFGVYQMIDSVYTDNYSTYLGCDSVYSHQLIVQPVYDITVVANICQGDSILIDGVYESTAGTFIDSYSSIFGCDSVVKTTLFVHPNYNLAQAISICSNDSIYLAGDYQNISGVYTDSLNSFYGCDSVIVTTLTVNTIPIVDLDLSFLPEICSYNAPFVLTGGTPAGGTYSGAGVTSDSLFTPSGSLIGTVQITYSFADSTGCIVSAIDSLIVSVCGSVPESISTSDFIVYPNPFNDILLIESENNTTTEISIFNLLGEVVCSQKITKGKTEIDLSALSSGVYFICNTLSEKQTRHKLVKK